MAGRTVDDRLHAADIRLPGTVGTAMGMGDLDAENDALSADITFSH